MWYYLRALDRDGSGIVEIKTQKTAEDLSVSRRTVTEWIKGCSRSGFFRDCQKLESGKSYKIYYLSVLNVFRIKGITANHGVFLADLKNHRDLKVDATLAIALGNQERSRYAAIKARNKRRKQRASNEKIGMPILSSTDLFKGCDNTYQEYSPSLLCSGAMGYFYMSRILLICSVFSHFGSSQKRIANQLERHPNTIQKRLHKARVQKVRLAKYDPDGEFKKELALANYDRSAHLFFKMEIGSKQASPDCFRKTFKKLTNIYYPSVILLNNKYINKSLNKVNKEGVGVVCCEEEKEGLC